mmetsp:Transcript_29627/g.55078  ORF Transcript_29627/g.55078 Transcript_29627/m.55078 type:complete len:95 (-) Transcript_29627:170-454(-)
MQFERVRPIAMGCIFFEIFWEIDDINGLERTFFHTYTTAYAQRLRDKSQLALGANLDAQLPELHDWATLLTFLSTFLRLALLNIDDGNPRQMFI